MKGAEHTAPKNQEYRPVTRIHLLRIWLIGGLGAGFLAIASFFSIAERSEVDFLFGYSMGRYAILVCLVAGVGFFSYFAYRTWRSPGWARRLENQIRQVLQLKLIYFPSVALTLTGVWIFSQLFHFSGAVHDPYVQGYLQKLRPFFLWFLALSAQTLVMFPLFRYGLKDPSNILSKKTLFLSAVIFSGLLAAGVLIAATGIGVEPDIIGWDGPGTPIMVVQVILIWVAGILFLGVETWSSERDQGCRIRFDLLISVLLWGAAAVCWHQAPLKADYFAPSPRAPNFEVYPYSDAALHDVNAQELLVGEGFPGVSRKPLYTMFLAMLHVIAGQDYLHVVNLQLSVLALIPVLIYWLTKDLHTRLSGFLAAGLIIVREWNAISLSGEIRVSHSKLLMSDMPAVLAIVLLTWLLVIWQRTPQRERVMPIWIGGVLGLLMLLRPQFSLLIPLIFLFGYVRLCRHFVFGLANLALILVGLFLTLSPWLWRSYRLTSTFTLNDPNQMAFLTEQYHREPQTESLQQIPGESISAFNARINRYLRDFIFQNPGYVARFIADHFVHNQIEMVQVLPVSLWVVNNPGSDMFPHWRQNVEKLWNDCCSLQSFVARHKFWDPWHEPVQRSHLVPILLNFAILSIGLSAAWQRAGAIAWIPIIISLAYSFSTAVGRYSGWRLILPADWVVFLYYSIGLGQITLWLQCYFGGLRSPAGDHDASINYSQVIWEPKILSKFPWLKAVGVSLILFSLGITPLVIEAAVPGRYLPQISIESVAVEFPQFNKEDIRVFLEAEGGKVVQGRALYPRFYRGGEGEPGESWAAFLVRPNPRLGFFMVGPQKGNVILPIETSPDWFPHAVDVLVLGCQKETFLDAAAVKIVMPGGKEDVIFRESLQNLTCPLPHP